MSLEKKDMGSRRSRGETKSDIIKKANSFLQLYIDDEMLMSEPNKDLIRKFKAGKKALKDGDYETAIDALETAVELWQSDLEYDEVGPLIEKLRSLDSRLRSVSAWYKIRWTFDTGRFHRLIFIFDSKKNAQKKATAGINAGWKDIVRPLPDRRYGVFREIE